MGGGGGGLKGWGHIFKRFQYEVVLGPILSNIFDKIKRPQKEKVFYYLKCKRCQGVIVLDHTINT